MDGSAAQSIYRLEKERAMQERRLSHTALMAEAKEAFAKLLADAQLARKGGRPRTNPLPPPKPAVVAAPVATKPVNKAATSAKREGPAVKKGAAIKVKAAAKPKAKKAAKPAKKAKAAPKKKAAGKKRV